MESPFSAGRTALAEASDLMERFGDDAGLEAAVRAEAAGFELDGQSEVNANPADTRDHPNGVWTLPPSNNHDDADDAKYQAIGESDRMTLRFRKPGAAG